MGERIQARLVGPFACIPPCLAVGLVQREVGISSGVGFFIAGVLCALLIPAIILIPRLRRASIPSSELLMVGGFLFLLGSFEVKGLASHLLLAMSISWWVGGVGIASLQITLWYRRRNRLPDDPGVDPVAEEIEVTTGLTIPVDPQQAPPPEDSPSGATETATASPGQVGTPQAEATTQSASTVPAKTAPTATWPATTGPTTVEPASTVPPAVVEDEHPTLVRPPASPQTAPVQHVQQSPTQPGAPVRPGTNEALTQTLPQLPGADDDTMEHPVVDATQELPVVEEHTLVDDHPLTGQDAPTDNRRRVKRFWRR